jgi:hypothetical protein
MKQKRKPYVPNFLVLLGSGFVGICIGMLIHYTLPVQRATPSMPEQDGVVNMPALNPENQQEFFMSQIITPSGYYVTSQDMITSFDTMGGMAPPRLILMKGYQVLGEPQYYKQVTDNPSHECIVIWATMGFPKIEDWNYSITRFSGKMIEKEQIQVGKRLATMYTMQGKNSNTYIAFLPLQDKEETTYYFNTCNTKNKKDFIAVIQSLKFRADLDLQ